VSGQSSHPPLERSTRSSRAAAPSRPRCRRRR
jgi:hypothetical protein